MLYVKTEEREAALPFVLRALELRRQLNAADCAAREEDSDEDPRDLVRRESDRAKRIRAKWGKRKKQARKEAKKRALADKKALEEQQREKKRKEFEREKMKAAQQAEHSRASGGVEGVRKASLQTMRAVMSFSQRKSQEELGEGEASQDVSAWQQEQRQEEETSLADRRNRSKDKREGKGRRDDPDSARSPSSDGPGSASARSSRLGEKPGSARSPKSGRSGRRTSVSSNKGGVTASARSSTNGQSGRRPSVSSNEGDVTAAATATSFKSENNDDAEVDAEDVGVDVRGWLAGTIGTSMQMINTVYMDLKDVSTAKWYLSRAIRIREEVYGSSSPEYGESLNAFRVWYHRQVQHVTALKHFREALHVREKKCGHIHEDTALSCIELGSVLMVVFCSANIEGLVR